MAELVELIKENPATSAIAALIVLFYIFPPLWEAMSGLVLQILAEILSPVPDLFWLAVFEGDLSAAIPLVAIVGAAVVFVIKFPGPISLCVQIFKGLVDQ